MAASVKVMYVLVKSSERVRGRRQVGAAASKQTS
jgi:hypothetical protein